MALVADKKERISKFQEHSVTILDGLDTLVSKRCLYEHQADATRAIVKTLNSHNSESREQNIALAVLPTGTGKSGIAVLAAYAVGASRLLVITPSEAISRQLYTDFCGLGTVEDASFLVRQGIIEQGTEEIWIPLGMLVFNSKQLRDRRYRFHPIVIANAHKFGSGTEPKKGVPINSFPVDSFPVVIVDEAHHYPAKTWKKIIDHFRTSKIIFLTATPYHRGKHILGGKECFRLDPDVAIRRGIIRDKHFIEVEKDMELLVHETLNEHDAQDPDFVFPVMKDTPESEKIPPKYKHQAMVICQTIADLNGAEEFIQRYDAHFPGECAAYHSQCKSGPEVLKNFKNGQIRVLVIIGRLLEGFDHKPVSVVGIYRNVAPASRVLFAQFVGRAVRKIRPDDPVTATVISAVRFNQKSNFDDMDNTIGDEDPDDEC